jgi:hypothetical protein
MPGGISQLFKRALLSGGCPAHPFSDDCVVMTGSHNLDHKPSFNNDENLVIVKGYRGLAEDYATHVLDI